MSELQAYLGDHAIPELFNRLYGDAEKLSGDIERLQRFVELTMAKRSSAPASNPVAKERDLDSWLQRGFISREKASVFSDRSIGPDPQPSASAPVEVTNAEFRLQLEDEADQPAEGQMVARFQLKINEADIVADLAPAPAPEPSASAPVEREAGARKVLEEEADAAARGMVLSFELLTRQGQSTATSLAAALRVMREVSSGFNCPQMMVEILKALDGMDAAAREEQSNG